MQPVSSVEAFLALYLEHPEHDAVAAEILSQLSDGERAVLKTRGLDQEARLLIGAAALSTTWPHWGEAVMTHVEGGALVRLRRALQERRLLHL